MTSRAEVTFSMVTFNHERWITQCLDSAVNQTFEKSRIIVLDDASEDSTVQVVERYMPEHPGRVELVVHSVNPRLGKPWPKDYPPSTPPTLPTLLAATGWNASV